MPEPGARTIIATMDRNSGNVLGSVCRRSISPGSTGRFHWEKVSAWGADLDFGKQIHDKIDKMVIGGDKKWQWGTEPSTPIARRR